MPQVQVLPQNRPFDFGQVQQMNQAISNLFQVTEQQKIKNEEKSIANIISTVNPMGPEGVAKSPFEINQEIKSKIDLNRQGRGKPGLFNIFNPQGLPQGATPTEQGLQQSFISNLLGAQGQQREQEDRRLKTRLTEAQIGATEALGQQRTADALKGPDPTTPTTTKSIRIDLLSALDSKLSSIEGTAVSVGDRTRKGTGQKAFDALASDPTGSYQTVYDRARSHNVPKEEQDEQLKNIRESIFGDYPEVEQMHSMLERGVDIGKTMRATEGISVDLANKIMGKAEFFSGRGKEFTNFKKTANIDDELMTAIRSLGNDISLEDGIFAIKENIYDNQNLDNDQADNLVEFIGEGLSFESDEKELKIAKGDRNLFNKMNIALSKIFQESKDNADYKEKYKKALKKFEEVDNLDALLTLMINR